MSGRLVDLTFDTVLNVQSELLRKVSYVETSLDTGVSPVETSVVVVIVSYGKDLLVEWARDAKSFLPIFFVLEVYKAVT